MTAWSIGIVCEGEKSNLTETVFEAMMADRECEPVATLKHGQRCTRDTEIGNYVDCYDRSEAAV